MSDLGKNLSPSNRGKKQKIRKSNKRKLSSTNWIKRQINDPYVIAVTYTHLRAHETQ